MYPRNVQLLQLLLTWEDEVHAAARARHCTAACAAAAPSPTGLATLLVGAVRALPCYTLD